MALTSMLKCAEHVNGPSALLCQSFFLLLFFTLLLSAGKAWSIQTTFFIIPCWSGSLTTLKNYPVYPWMFSSGLRSLRLRKDTSSSAFTQSWQTLVTLLLSELHLNLAMKLKTEPNSVHKKKKKSTRLNSAHFSIYFRNGETNFWSRWPGEMVFGIMTLHSCCFSNSAARQISLPFFFSGLVNPSLFQGCHHHRNKNISSLELSPLERKRNE